MTAWLDVLAALLAEGTPTVAVTVAGVRGSAPRETGARMLVTRDASIGTIGGGQLEYECTRLAAGMLGSEGPGALRRFPLGAAMGQCCGGVVDVLFEPLGATSRSWHEPLLALHRQRRPAVLVTSLGDAVGKTLVSDATRADDVALPAEVFDRAMAMLAPGATSERTDEWLLEPVAESDFHIAVFGAGHVGAAVVDILRRLDCRLRWIDTRRDIFDDVPPGVDAIESSQPVLEVAAMPSGSFYLVMTHSHALDFDICDRILRRGDAAYCGLIGSATKRRRFEKRFREQGLAPSAIASLTCPIGLPGIDSKRPADIAVGVAAQLLQIRERHAAAAGTAYPDNVHPLSG